MNTSSCTPCMDGDMTDTGNAAAGCLSNIRNRLFCGCKLPSLPDESVKQVKRQVEMDHSNNLGIEKAGKVFVSPGIVARLMGLESMPVPKERSVDSVRRSRSASSINCWPESDPVQGYHRRVRTSLSFHDIPTFLQIDENECVLVRSGNVGEMKGLRSKERRPKLKRREGVAQRKERQVCRKIVFNEQHHRRKSIPSRPTENAEDCRNIKYGCSVPSGHRIHCIKAVGVSREKIPSQLANHTAARPTKEKVRHDSLKRGKQAECSSANIRVKPKSHVPAKEQPRRRNPTNSRKKEPLEILNSRIPSRKHSNHNLNPLKEEARRRKQSGRTSKPVCYLQLRRDVCRLVEEDLKSLEWKPIGMWKLVHVEELGIELGVGILNRLVHEVVADLCGFPMENLGLLLMEGYLY